MLPHADGEILNDEVVIIHSSGSVDEPEVFEPYTGVRFPSVSSNVGGWSEALWERHSLDAMTKGPWPRAIRARALVVWLATMPGMCVPALLDGPARDRAACCYRRTMDVIITPGLTPIVDDAASVSVRPEPLAHRGLVWSVRRVRPWCSCVLLFHARRL